MSTRTSTKRIASVAAATDDGEDDNDDDAAAAPAADGDDDDTDDPYAPLSTTGPILGLRPVNERRRYFVTTSLIGWAQA